MLYLTYLATSMRRLSLNFFPQQASHTSYYVVLMLESRGRHILAYVQKPAKKEHNVRCIITHVSTGQ